MAPWLVLLLIAQDEPALAAANIQEAARLYHAAAERDPTEQNLLNLANHLIRYNGAAEALKILAWARDKHPRSAPLRVSEAAALHVLSRYDEAALAIAAAVDLDPADRRTLPFLADFRDISATHRDALATRLAAYAKRFPSDAFARFHHGLTLTGAARERELREARRLDPSLAGPALELGILLDQRGEWRQAEPLLIEATRVEPASVNAHYRLAQLYARTGRASLAKRHFAEVARLKASR